MNALAKKELRLIAPPWTLALILAIWPFQLSILLFMVAILLLALTPFGLEASNHTFNLLLVQPIDRRKIWWIKITFLIVALVSVLIVYLLKGLVGLDSENMSNRAQIGLIVLLLGFSGALWTTLLLRDIAMSVICTIAAPIAITAAVSFFLSPWKKNLLIYGQFNSVLYRFLIAYSIAGILWAYGLFINAQDLPWTGPQISTRFGIRSRRTLFLRSYKPWLALIFKEVRLQYGVIMVTAVMLLLEVIVLILYHLKFVSQEIFVGVIIWTFCLPCLIGCISVAEERRSSTLQTQLTLPVKRSITFLIKAVITIMLGTLIGILPWIPMRFFLLNEFDSPLSYMILFSATGTMVGFYASTMTRSLMQAIPFAVINIAGFAYLLAGYENLFGRSLNYSLSRKLDLARHSLLFNDFTVMFLAILWLGFKNYGQILISGKLWLKNIAWILVITIGYNVLQDVYCGRPPIGF